MVAAGRIHAATRAGQGDRDTEFGSDRGTVVSLALDIICSSKLRSDEHGREKVGAGKSGGQY